MKAYYIIFTSVHNFSKSHSQAWVSGYIYSLLDWRVISQETYERLVLCVAEYFHKKKLSSYDPLGNQIK